MYNNFETDEIIADAIGESLNVPTGVTMWGGPKSNEKVNVDLSELEIGTDIFIDGRLFTKLDEDEWGYSIGFNPATHFLDCEVAAIVNRLSDKSSL